MPWSGTHFPLRPLGFAPNAPLTAGVIDMKLYKTPKSVPYPRYSSNLRKIDELLSVKYNSKYFTMFIAANWNEINNAELLKVAKQLIVSGLRYICTWGRGCERAHDLFDQANIKVQQDSESDLLVMSSWHEDETLEEALWYWLYCAMVDDEYWEECIGIGVSICNPDWNTVIDASLTDVKKLCRKIDKGDPGNEVIR